MNIIRKVSYERGSLSFTYFKGQQLKGYRVEDIRLEVLGSIPVICIYVGDGKEYAKWKDIQNWGEIEYDYEDLFSY